MRRASRGTPGRFRVFLDGGAPGPAHGSGVGEQGTGTVSDLRLYQLIRQPKPIADRQCEIEFLDAGKELSLCKQFLSHSQVNQKC